MRSCLLLVALVVLAVGPRALGEKKDGPVLELQQGGGVTPPRPDVDYTFTLDRDGTWTYRAPRVKYERSGKLAEKEVREWLTALEKGGFEKVKSNEALGAADEPFLVLIVRTPTL